MKQKYPLRKPLILTHDELLWLIRIVGERYEYLNLFLARGRKGQLKLRGAVNFLSGLQRKLWKV